MRRLSAVVLVLMSATAWAQFPKPPKISIPDPPKLPDVKKKADDLLAAATALAGTSAAAAKPFRSAGKTAYLIGETVIDPTEAVGKPVAGAADTFEMLKDGKTVGRFVIKDGKITATEIIDSAGKYGTPVPVAGAKFIAKDGKIAGREILVGGKLVGEEIITNGKLTGNKVTDTAEYALNKGNEIVLKGLSANVCNAAATALRTGSRIDLPAVPGLPGLPAFADGTARVLKQGADQLAVLKKDAMKKGTLLAMGEKGLNGAPYAPDEMIRLVDSVSLAKVKEFFTDPSTCTGSEANLEQKLISLGLKPNFTKKTALLDFFVPVVHAADPPSRFFTTYNLSFDAGLGAGAVLTLSAITDFTGQGGFYDGIGGQIVTNGGANANFTIGFYPKVPADSFEGWSWAVGFSAGKERKMAGGGAEFNYNETFSELQGFGFSAGVGANKFPADVNIGAGYTWKVAPAPRP